jgi:hypothetical protein
MMFFYGLFLLIFTFFSYLFIDQNLLYLKKLYTGFAFLERITTTEIFVGSVFLFFIFYGVFLYKTHKQKLNIKNVKILIGLTSVILFFSYPAVLSYDIFNYITTAKVLFFYHENPYIIMPVEFIGDPYLLFTHAANKIALYGPAWTVLTGLPYLLGFGNFFIILFNFKLLMAFFYMAISYLIFKMTKNLLAVVFFSLNPLIIIETLVSSHNDIVMMFLSLLSFYLLTKKRIWLAILFFALSILIKYATLFLLPIFAFMLWKYINRQKINSERIYMISFLSMILIFFLSAFREEIYPWYGIWFLTFSSLILKKKIIVYLSVALSLGLLMRYIPFMYLGTYFGPTPLIKIILMWVPVVISALFIIALRNKKLKQIFFKFK